MPIYAYRCSACGHAKDALQKLSDAPLTTCPACGAETFSKQVTAAGFQLKGSGWYVTDFRSGSGGGGTAAAPAAEPAKASSSTESSGGTSGGSSGGSTEGSSASSSTGCGGPCACH